jgi:hypothetical protein
MDKIRYKKKSKNTFAMNFKKFHRKLKSMSLKIIKTLRLLKRVKLMIGYLYYLVKIKHIKTIRFKV